ncbi:MAG: glycerol-3-phosphate 1-O-acyltransferase PlsY [Pseudomonadota bacterium]
MPDPINMPWDSPILWITLGIYFAALLFGYLLGSIPFGLILTRFAGIGDVREIGSGNIGATNVLRTGNKKIAALTLLGDLLKGTVAVITAAQYGPDPAVLAGLGAFVGHCFPVWLRFKGGKGVATYIGILLGFTWKVMLVFAVTWLLVAAVTRFSSLAALVASLATPIVLFVLGHVQWAELFALLTILLWIRHRENITRLIKGQESKIGKK